MKVLVVNTVPTERNGITGVIMNYLKACRESELTFDLLSINKPDIKYVEQVESLGGKVYVQQRSAARVISYWAGIRNLISRNKYDAVHVHGNSHTIVLELSAAYFSGCKTRIAHCHNTSCSHEIAHRLLKYPFDILYTQAFACGKDAGQWMFGDKPFVVLNNGVDTERFSFNEEKRCEIRSLLRYDGKLVIGHIGSFIPVKNQKYLLPILRELLQRDERYRLLLIGDGPMRQDLMTEVEQSGLGQYVTFAGGVDNVEAYLSAMDVIAMPSLFEGLPLTLVEQQVNGLPCVVSDTITAEVDFAGRMKFLPLDSPTETWADALESAFDDGDRPQRSCDAVARVKQAGFDILVEAKKYAGYLLQAS